MMPDQKLGVPALEKRIKALEDKHLGVNDLPWPGLKARLEDLLDLSYNASVVNAASAVRTLIPAVVPTFAARASGTATVVGGAGFDVAIAWTTEDYDTGSQFTAGGSQFTVPTGGDGRYLVTAQLNYPANGTGARWTAIRQNGTEVLGNTCPGVAGATQRTQVNGILALVAGDYLETWAAQTSGTNYTPTGWMVVHRLST